ncbi:hypothetical protein DACRYDRAFT_115500 [Dacryopinax primogenitus]|uniref:Uncharacterized protein n=1 Tax=Dacryopinax primogenitus (strain DJM 731) TaxID=1858805 RepID=M5GEJ4_DACPD|nr:uncharacterized protein DACRYDRAFT_115500 [Dacryopinax primogenitus]EJU03313.1 hypothetical protein DACRYDRAFT_115500 [Dacryopinax primogenitus]
MDEPMDVHHEARKEEVHLSSDMTSPPHSPFSWSHDDAPSSPPSSPSAPPPPPPPPPPRPPPARSIPLPPQPVSHPAAGEDSAAASVRTATQHEVTAHEVTAPRQIPASPPPPSSAVLAARYSALTAIDSQADNLGISISNLDIPPADLAFQPDEQDRITQSPLQCYFDLHPQAGV